MANVIWRGPVHLAQPNTKTGKTAASILPGTVVTVKAGVIAVAKSGKDDIYILSNRAYIGETLDVAIPSGDTAEAFKIADQYEFNVRMAEATYAQGAQLSVNATGQFKAAVSGDVVVAVFDEEASRAVSAGGLADVRIIPNSYVAV